MAEQLTLNQWVEGSSPPRLTQRRFYTQIHLLTGFQAALIGLHCAVPSWRKTKPLALSRPMWKPLGYSATPWPRRLTSGYSSTLLKRGKPRCDIFFSSNSSTVERSPWSCWNAREFTGRSMWILYIPPARKRRAGGIYRACCYGCRASLSSSAEADVAISEPCNCSSQSAANWAISSQPSWLRSKCARPGNSLKSVRAVECL